MFIYKKQYDLPDLDIVNSEKERDFKIWKPDKNYIVLGKSDKIETAIIKQENEDIDEKYYILKRPSGGHTVVLSPKTLVIAVVVKTPELSPKQLFSQVNATTINALKGLKISNLNENGISDISIGDKKILGSSMHKNKNYLFYHAVLNVLEEPSFIAKLLAHPTSEPDYRKQRSHIDFMTNILTHNPLITIDLVEERLNQCFKKEWV